MTNDVTVKRKSKDSVFVKFFSYIENVKQLYEEFHPEITDLKEEDIQVQTLDSAIVNTIYNDLGFIVKDRYVVLVEAQSTWNPNMALRMLFYISETYRRYLIDTQQSEHSTSKVNLPKPELYVIYTGEQEKPEEISFSEEFFGGNSDIELKIKVLSKVDAFPLPETQDPSDRGYHQPGSVRRPRQDLYRPEGTARLYKGSDSAVSCL